MKKARLSEFYTTDEVNVLAFIWNPLIRAMGAGIKELEVTPEEFLNAMRSAVAANVYHHVFNSDGTDYPTILAMKITVL